MRHRRAHRKLGRTTSHRIALLRNLVTEFFDKEKVITTVPKAKELRPFAEKLITLGKRDSLHARRQAVAVIRTRPVVQKLFETLAPRFADRNGGYTRIVRLGPRPGDNAEMALIELIGSEYQAAKPAKKGEKPPKEAKAKGAKEAKTKEKSKAESSTDKKGRRNKKPEE